jgi:hypothetical protein
VSKEAMEAEIELMEKEIVYFKGRKRSRARQRYLQLIRSCGKTCALDNTIYIDRT